MNDSKTIQNNRNIMNKLNLIYSLIPKRILNTDSNIQSIKEMKKPLEEKSAKKFSIKEVLFYGFATAVDALAAGVVLHAGLSTVVTVWLHVSIILVLTFVISLIGLFLGKQIIRLLKGKYEIAGIIGGCILILLAVWVVISHYLPL